MNKDRLLGYDEDYLEKIGILHPHGECVTCDARRPILREIKQALIKIEKEKNEVPTSL